MCENIIQEGSDVFINFSFTGIDENGNVIDITNADKIEYRLSDGKEILIDWSEITPPIAPGQLVIPGVNNRVTNNVARRDLTFFVTYNGDNSVSITTTYYIRDSSNITQDSP